MWYEDEVKYLLQLPKNRMRRGKTWRFNSCPTVFLSSLALRSSSFLSALLPCSPLVPCFSVSPLDRLSSLLSFPHSSRSYPLSHPLVRERTRGRRRVTNSKQVGEKKEGRSGINHWSTTRQRDPG